jgi:uncharacterized protein (DUF427 family)
MEPVPRRIRAYAGTTLVLDSIAARYVWEWPHYPQFYVPLADVTPGLLVDEGVDQLRLAGPARLHGLQVEGATRAGAAWVQTDGLLRDTVRFDWAALDRWFEEDEQIFVHPRNPYSRTDALRSTREVRVEIDGVVLAESSSPVLLFETGLPTRYYLPRTALRYEYLEPSESMYECAYKGRTTAYWSARVNGTLHRDIAWSYDHPTPQVLPIAGLVAFYNEKLDLFLDGEKLDRPVTSFSAGGYTGT